MKKKYIAPEMEQVKLTLRDVILTSPTEGDVPIQIDDPELPDPGGDGLDL